MSETLSNLSTDTGGTEVTRFNALRHGVLSRYTVLRPPTSITPWSQHSWLSMNRKDPPRSIW